MIKKDTYQKLSTKIKKEQALRRLNNRLNDMIDQGTHWGYKSLRNSWKRLSHPEMSSAFLGNRKGVQIIDPAKTLRATVRGLYFAALVLKNNGRILIADTREEFSPVNYIFSSESIRTPISLSGTGKRWIAGTLTNWETISPRISEYGYISTVFKNNVEKLRVHSPRFVKMKNSFPGLIDMHSLHFGFINNQPRLKFQDRPDLIIVCQPEENSALIREAFRLKIPVLAFVDSNSSLNHITYPIPANTENHNWIYYCLNLLVRLAKILKNIN
jgi:small subunit ribosomal protein S2